MDDFDRSFLKTMGVLFVGFLLLILAMGVSFDLAGASCPGV